MKKKKYPEEDSQKGKEEKKENVKRWKEKGKNVGFIYVEETDMWVFSRVKREIGSRLSEKRIRCVTKNQKMNEVNNVKMVFPFRSF